MRKLSIYFYKIFYKINYSPRTDIKTPEAAAERKISLSLRLTLQDSTFSFGQCEVCRAGPTQDYFIVTGGIMKPWMECETWW